MSPKFHVAVRGVSSSEGRQQGQVTSRTPDPACRLTPGQETLIPPQQPASRLLFFSFFFFFFVLLFFFFLFFRIALSRPRPTKPAPPPPASGGPAGAPQRPAASGLPRPRLASCRASPSGRAGGVPGGHGGRRSSAGPALGCLPPAFLTGRRRRSGAAAGLLEGGSRTAAEGGRLQEERRKRRRNGG